MRVMKYPTLAVVGLTVMISWIEKAPNSLHLLFSELHRSILIQLNIGNRIYDPS